MGFLRALEKVVDPRPLAIARVGVGVATILNAVEAYSYMLGVVDGQVALPLWPWLPPLEPGPVLTLVAVELLAAVALTVGFLSRTAAATVAACTWALFAWEQQTYSNHFMLTAWLALWLAFSRSDAVWSLHAKMTRRRGVRLVDQLLLMTQLSICYFFAAIVKVNGNFLGGDYLDRVTWPALPSWVFVTMGFTTVAVELFLSIGLWLRETRRLALVVGVGLHLSIPLMMPNWYPLLSFSLLCLSLYPMFFVLQREPATDHGVTREELAMAAAAP